MLIPLLKLMVCFSICLRLMIKCGTKSLISKLKFVGVSDSIFSLTEVS